ncbi:hypothetical protein [Romboutsia sp.]
MKCKNKAQISIDNIKSVNLSSKLESNKIEISNDIQFHDTTYKIT